MTTTYTVWADNGTHTGQEDWQVRYTLTDKTAAHIAAFGIKTGDKLRTRVTATRTKNKKGA